MMNTGCKRFHKLFVEVGRKNAKSQMIAGVLLYEIAVDVYIIYIKSFLSDFTRFPVTIKHCWRKGLKAMQFTNYQTI